MKPGQSIQELFEEFSELEAFGLHQLLLQCRSRGISFDLERSLRIDRSGVSSKRLLVSLDAMDYHRVFAETPFAIYDSMNMQRDQLEQLRNFFPKAWRIHFGWELGGNGWTAKSYLEMRPKVSRTEGASTHGESIDPGQVLFLGYKWPLLDGPAGVVSKYTVVTHSQAKQAIDCWEDSLLNLSNDYATAEWHSLTAILRNCSATVDPLLVLEVCDEGSARRSYDINLYDLEQTVDTIREPLSRVISPWLEQSAKQQMQQELRSISAAKLGHLATGIDRHGSMFWTLYYGAVHIVTQPR